MILVSVARELLRVGHSDRFVSGGYGCIRIVVVLGEVFLGGGECGGKGVDNLVLGLSTLLFGGEGIGSGFKLVLEIFVLISGIVETGAEVLGGIGHVGNLVFEVLVTVPEFLVVGRKTSEVVLQGGDGFCGGGRWQGSKLADSAIGSLSPAINIGNLFGFQSSKFDEGVL